MRALGFPYEPVFTIANLGEALFWIVLGVVVWVRWHRRGPAVQVLVTALVAFGVSDVVEVYTGAWWRPVWLLAWKAAAAVLIVAMLTALRRRG